MRTPQENQAYLALNIDVNSREMHLVEGENLNIDFLADNEKGLVTTLRTRAESYGAAIGVNYIVSLSNSELVYLYSFDSDTGAEINTFGTTHINQVDRAIVELLETSLAIYKDNFFRLSDF